MDRQIQIYIENELLDLFDNENIIVNSTVQNVNDISKIFTDFSQSFTVPATQRNNRIFKYWFEPDNENRFDARVKKKGRIELSYTPFKEGKFRLESVKFENSEPSSYKITFFGNLTSLTDLFGEDMLSDLDFSPNNHARDYITTRIGFTIGIFNPTNVTRYDIIYPLLSNERQFFYNSDISTDINTPKLVNIAYDNINQVGGIDWTELKPALLVKQIIERIELKYSVTFSDEFFSLPIFDELYMWLQTTKEKINTASGQRLIDVETRDSGTANFWDLTTNKASLTLISSPSGEAFGTERLDFTINVTPLSGYLEIDYQLFARINGGEKVDISNLIKGSNSITYYAKVLDSGTFNVEVELFLESQDPFIYDISITTRKQVKGNLTWFNLAGGAGVEVVSSTFLSYVSTLNVSQNMPEISVANFLSGIVKLFNLVIIPITDTEFFIDTLDNWYASGTTVDISSYVDTTDFDLNRGKVTSKIDFTFEEGKTILIEERKNLFGSSYGDIKLDIVDENGNPVDGTPFNLKVPFEQMVYERLVDLNDNVATNIQYGLVTDEDISPVLMKPHLFFSENLSLPTKRYSNISPSNDAISNNTYWKVSHTDSTGEYSTIFNNEVDEFTGEVITNTLYANNYANYITGIFNPKRRLYSYKCRLPISLLSSLKLNDKVIINSRRFIINNMKTNLTTGIVDFELLNDIY